MNCANCAVSVLIYLFKGGKPIILRITKKSLQASQTELEKNCSSFIQILVVNAFSDDIAVINHFLNIIIVRTINLVGGLYCELSLPLFKCYINFTAVIYYSNHYIFYASSIFKNNI